MKNQKPLSLGNGHVETILPYFLRRVKEVDYFRERISTPDEDFLDLDWSCHGRRQNHQKLVVLSHGLEGSSQGKYIRGMINYLSDKGFDCLAWNSRHCSGEPNKHVYSYHSGASHDLRTVMEYVDANTSYGEIYFIGFSMGGNITLKYLGEQGADLKPQYKAAVAFSVPCDLGDCAQVLSKGFRRLAYGRKFIISLCKKNLEKEEKFKEAGFDLSRMSEIKTFMDFDEMFTAPLTGFKSATEYYDKSSSKQFIKNIRLPTLIINAANDPFLGSKCYPYKEVDNHKYVSLEIPKSGGHVGFYSSGFSGFWSEQRAYDFFVANSSV